MPNKVLILYKILNRMFPNHKIRYSANNNVGEN